MIGTVLGELSLSRGPEAVRTHRWVQVEIGGRLLTAMDLADARKGELVLVLSGEAARTIAMDCPGDWAVTAVVAPQGNNG